MNIPKCPTWNELKDDFAPSPTSPTSSTEQPEIIKIISQKESTLLQMKEECEKVIEFLKEQNLLSNSRP